MNCSLRTTLLPFVTAGTLFCPCAATATAQEERPTRAVSKPWQRDISQFDAELRQMVREAKVPDREAFLKRFEEKSSGLEVITDGSGGVVDFDPAEGTVQSVANERFGGMNIEWEFELANDTKILWDKSTKLIPKIASTAKDVRQDSEQPLFTIRIESTDAGPFHSGNHVRVKASIDDFSRFRKDCSRAFGLVTIYYLEKAPNPVFLLKLDEAEVTLIKENQKGADKSDPAKSEGTPEKGAAENGQNKLDNC